MKISFLAKRLFHSIFVLLGLSIVIFLIARIVPGDPVRLAVGARAPQWVVDNLRKSMHLNKSIFMQYVYWLRDALHGQFGLSLVTRREVGADIVEFLPATLEVAFYALLVSLAGSLSFGIISARYKDRWPDNVIRVFSYLGIVTPSFVFAIIFILVFAFVLGWLPAIGRLSNGITAPPRITGFLTIDALLKGNFVVFWDALKHIMMPAMALAMGSMAQEARITRSSMADNLTKDYIASSRALGVSESLIMRRFL